MIDSLETIEILDINISCVRRESILQIPLKWMAASHKRTILYVNAHCLNLSVHDRAYHTTLNSADLVYSDGIGVVWAAKYLSGCVLEKITGRDWIHDFCALAYIVVYRPVPGTPALPTRLNVKPI